MVTTLRCRSLILIAGIMATALPALAGTITAVLDKSRGTVDDTYVYEMTISGSYKCDPRMPVVNGITVTSTRSSTNIFFGSGGSGREQTFGFEFNVDDAGTYEIPSFACKVDGKDERTAPLRLIVSAAGGTAPSGPGNNGQAPASGEPVMLKRVFSKTSAFVGEAILVTTRILSSLQIIQQPSLTAEYAPFKKIAVGGDQKVIQENINGVPFQVIELHELLIASKPQTIKVPSAQAEVAVRAPAQQGRRRGAGGIFDLFDDPFFSQRAVGKRLRAPAVDIVVASLPKEGWTAQFSGLVGDFQIEAATIPATAKVGDNLTFTVTVSGDGNLAGFDKLPWEPGDGWKLYRDKSEESHEVTDQRKLHARKTFKFVLVPKRGGALTVAPIQLVYFSPTEKTYKTASVTFTHVTVTGASQETAPTLTPDAPVAEPSAASTTPTPSPAATDASSLSDQLQDLWYSQAFRLSLAVLGALLCVGVAAFVVYRRRRQFMFATMAQRRRRGALKELKGKLATTKTADAQLHAFYGFIAAINNSDARSLTSGDVLSFAEGRIADSDRAALKLLMQRWDGALYAGNRSTVDHQAQAAEAERLAALLFNGFASKGHS